MSQGDFARLVRLLPRTYRARREQELLTVISDASQGEPHRAREAVTLIGLVVQVWSLKLIGLDGAQGPAARRFLAWLLPVVLVFPIAVWFTEGLISPLLHGWPINLTWDPSWRSWLLWALALCFLALGRLRASALAGALATGIYAAVLVHIALRNNPKSVVEGVGWIALQSAAVLAVATCPDTGRNPWAWRRRLVPMAVATSLFLVGVSHAVAFDWNQLWLFQTGAWTGTAELAAAAGIGVLVLSPAGRLVVPVIVAAGIDFVVARTLVTPVGDYGPGQPGWAALRLSDYALLAIAPIVAFAIGRLGMSILDRTMPLPVSVQR